MVPKHNCILFASPSTMRREPNLGQSAKEPVGRLGTWTSERCEQGYRGDACGDESLIEVVLKPRPRTRTAPRAAGRKHPRKPYCACCC